MATRGAEKTDKEGVGPEMVRIHASVSCHSSEYSGSRLAHAVEDCDLHLLYLDVCPSTGREGYLDIDIETSAGSLSRLVASLERYGYEVESADAPEGDETPDDTLSLRAAEVLRYLDV